MEDTTNNSPKRGFTIAALMLLIAVTAIGLAAARTTGQALGTSLATSVLTQWQYEEGVEALKARAVGGAVIGIFAGFVVGITRSRRVEGIIMAVPVAAVAGGLAAACLTQRENVPLVLVGSVVVVLLGVVVRTFSSHSQ
jgi:hypothetical protein